MLELKIAIFNLEWMISIFGGEWKKRKRPGIPEEFKGKHLGSIYLEPIPRLTSSCLRMSEDLPCFEEIGLTGGQVRCGRLYQIMINRFDSRRINA